MYNKRGGWKLRYFSLTTLFVSENDSQNTLYTIQSYWGLFLMPLILKSLYTFGTEKQIKVHRFTNNLQGLQKVMVKDLFWNYIPWNALLFEKTLTKQLSILRWPIEPKFSQVCYFIYKLWYTKCGRSDNHVNWKCPMALRDYQAYTFLLLFMCLFTTSWVVSIDLRYFLSTWNMLAFIINFFSISKPFFI